VVKAIIASGANCYIQKEAYRTLLHSLPRGSGDCSALLTV